MKASNKPVVVCTEHRGVFFGYVPKDQNVEASRITLSKARMCVYWSQDVRGVLGLAGNGPTPSCRIGPAVPAISLNGVTAVMSASGTATIAWEQGYWA